METNEVSMTLCSIKYYGGHVVCVFAEFHSFIGYH